VAGINEAIACQASRFGLAQVLHRSLESNVLCKLLMSQLATRWR
jgi:hypothetical protein